MNLALSGVNCLGAALLDAVFPPRCAGCGGWHKGLFCDDCARSLKPVAPPFCERCGLPLPSDVETFDARLPINTRLTHTDRCPDCRHARQNGASQAIKLMRSVYIFEDAIRGAVHRLKYKEKTALAAPLAGLMNEYLQSQGAQSHIPLERIELVVPVPLHAWRRYRRGYNQSELLAHELVLLMKRENSTVLCANILRRVRHTTSQVELNERDRVENVRGAFEATGAPASFHKNGAVLLIDDVCTTGATLRECARALEAAGVREIYALALARQL